MSDRLHRDVLGLLCPGLLDIPLADRPRHGEPRTPATVLTAARGPGTADWRRDPAGNVARFLRGYVLDHGEAGPVFGIVSRRAAERLPGAAAGRPAGGLGAGHAGRAAVRRLAQRPRAGRPDGRR